MRAYNSTHHSITGISPHMMLTWQEKALPLTFSYPENEGKKISPQVYVRDEIRRQQELNDLCKRNMQQAQAKNIKFKKIKIERETDNLKAETDEGPEK